MNESELWAICSPSRRLTHPWQLDDDIQQLKLKRENKENSYPVFTDSKQLILFLKKNLRNKPYFIANPFDILTKIVYKHSVYQNDEHYFYMQSRPIHYGIYRQEEVLPPIKTDLTSDGDILEELYLQKVASVRNQLNGQLTKARATWSDIVLINRRLLEHDLRVLQRGYDSALVVFRYNWIEDKLL